MSRLDDWMRSLGEELDPAVVRMALLFAVTVDGLTT
jgi:hypothetical protein